MTPHSGPAAEAIDFQLTPDRADLRAAGSGTVVLARPDVGSFTPVNSVYGNLVVIQHANGIFSYYAHLSAILVSEGQSVGSVIGRQGMTRCAGEFHVHLEARSGVNPADRINSGSAVSIRDLDGITWAPGCPIGVGGSETKPCGVASGPATS